MLSLVFFSSIQQPEHILLVFQKLQFIHEIKQPAFEKMFQMKPFLCTLKNLEYRFCFVFCFIFIKIESDCNSALRFGFHQTLFFPGSLDQKVLGRQKKVVSISGKSFFMRIFGVKVLQLEIGIFAQKHYYRGT